MTEEECLARMHAQMKAGQYLQVLQLFQHWTTIRPTTDQPISAELQQLAEAALAHIQTSSPRLVTKRNPARKSWIVLSAICLASTFLFTVLKCHYLRSVGVSHLSSPQLPKADTQLKIGSDLYQAARYAEALDVEQQAYAQMLKEGNRAGAASALAQVGEATQAQGRLTEAKDVYEQALALRRITGPPLAIAHLQQILGGLLLSTGDYASAREQLTASLHLREHNQDPVGVVLCQSDLGALAQEQKQYDLAAAWFTAARSGAEREHKPEIVASVTAQQGMLAYALGDTATARRLVTNSLQFWLQRRHPRWIAGMKRRLSQIACRDRKYAEAVQLAEESLSLYKQVGDMQGRARSSLTLACALAHAGQKTRATALYSESVSDAQAIHLHLPAEQIQETEQTIQLRTTGHVSLR